MTPTLFSILGVPTRVNFTTPLVFLGLLVLSPTYAICYMLGLLFVIPHEYGHAIVAKAYGIRVSDIIILPIAGFARMEWCRLSLKEELAVALAGPAVSLALTGICALIAVFGSEWAIIATIINAVIFLFNMLPCFPMDGGRVLRSILGSFMSYDNATLIAVRIGQILAIMMVIYGICILNIGLVISMALIIFLGNQELNFIRDEANQ